MNKVFGRLRPHTMDEMEKHIYFASQRNAHWFLMAILFVWTLYASFCTLAHGDPFNPVPGFMFTGSVFVQGISQAVLERRAVKGDDEYTDTSRRGTWVALALVATCIVVVAATRVILFIGA